jgi:hypothetical protein
VPDVPAIVHGLCPELDPAAVERHLQRMPASYLERHAPEAVARHLLLLSQLHGPHPVAVEVRRESDRSFEVAVVGEDLSGTVACITTALAADGFNLEDLHVATYADAEASPDDSGPCYFVIVLWVSADLNGRDLDDVTRALSGRLRAAFTHLAAGSLLDAQAAAADTALMRADSTRPSGRRPAPAPMQTSGLILGGDFVLEKRLMVGGMSEVHLATQRSLNRTVAVKLIRHEGQADDNMLDRFHREATVLGQFNSPYIVPVLAAGTVPEHGGGVLGWMAMEYLAGGDLAHWLARQGLPPLEQAVRWFRQALEGLHYAHRRSVLHRDLKPHNLLLTAEGDVKVSDFGLLKRIQRSAERAARGTIVGTPHYMSPEQTRGERLDERSDIFSLGTTFYQIFSGRLPFQQPTPQAVLTQIASEDAAPLHVAIPQRPRALSVIVGRMMARRPEERYQDVSVILEDLASYERRGLLRGADGPVQLPVEGLPSPADAETQAYQPPAGDDVVI